MENYKYNIGETVTLIKSQFAYGFKTGDKAKIINKKENLGLPAYNVITTSGSEIVVYEFEMS